MEKGAAIALVTGGNRGLGLGVAELLCERLGQASLVYIAARDVARGRTAADKLTTAGHRADFLELDLSSDASVAAAAATIEDRHGGLDILIGNAAMMPDGDQRDQVDAFLNTNNFGTHRLIRSFGPLLRDGARFLIVASRHGLLTAGLPAQSKATLDTQVQREQALREQTKMRLFGYTSDKMSEERKRIFHAETATLESIEAALGEFATSLKRGTALTDGWGDWINPPSKAGQIAATLVFARDMEAEARRRDILINVCCPGFVDTDATRAVYGDTTSALSPREAAENLVWAVTRPSGSTEPYGEMLFGKHAVRVHE